MNVTQEEGARPIKIWTDEVEDTALQQLKNLARLPFIAANGVACMPDVHAGIGATIGTVIATDKAIIPAAVGVDIGCFVGETRIPLLDGTQKTLRELADTKEPFWVYSINSQMKIAPGRAVCVQTRANAALMKVVVSGGDEIICTPDHEFMLSDGTYRQAKDLRFNESLMPLYRSWQTRDGYESVSNGKGTSRQTHILVWEAHNGPVPAGMIVHHKDHIHFNNRPDNFGLMSPSEHSAHHRQHGHQFSNSSPDFQMRRRAGIAARCADPIKLAKMAKVGSANIRKYMETRPEEFKAAVAGNGRRGAAVLAKFNVTARACVDCGLIAPNPGALHWHRLQQHQTNHKVISIEFIDRTDSVYCLQVEEHHNFALAAGVFVHNCGLNAVRLSLKASDLPDSLLAIRNQIERDVPLGAGGNHRPERAPLMSSELESRYVDLMAKHPRIAKNKATTQIGSLGSGNHFIEVCLDESQDVWIMLHSGSRGVGNLIGRYFIEKAKRRMEQYFITLPDGDLAYFPEDTDDFNDYVEAVNWAQDYALENRRQMMLTVIAALGRHIPVEFTLTQEAINCHHNYVERENHFGRNLWVTRKGAIRARDGDLGIIPGSMGQRSYIVRGKGNVQSYCSCSHGAGRKMSRAGARRVFTVADLVSQTEGVECRKDDSVLDEIPGAYKDIDAVMANQRDLVDVVHILKQVLCVKGG